MCTRINAQAAQLENDGENKRCEGRTLGESRLPPLGIRQDCKELAAALESRLGSAHQHELPRSKFKSADRSHEKSLQELAEVAACPRRNERLVSKAAIHRCYPRLQLKQSRPQTLQDPLTLDMELAF